MENIMESVDGPYILKLCLPLVFTIFCLFNVNHVFSVSCRHRLFTADFAEAVSTYSHLPFIDPPTFPPPPSIKPFLQYLKVFLIL